MRKPPERPGSVIVEGAVEWITLHIEEGQHLYVDGVELRTHEAATAWEARAKRWTEEAIKGVEDRRREDVARVRTLGRRPLVPMPPGHPYWSALPPVFLTHGTTSIGCEESSPLSRLHDRIESLKEIARDWRADPPELPLESPAKRFATSKDAEKAYAERVTNVRRETGRAPTVEADAAWGKEHGLTQRRWRELRRKCPLRTAADRRGHYLVKNQRDQVATKC